MITKVFNFIKQKTKRIFLDRVIGAAIASFTNKRENQLHPFIRETLELIETSIPVTADTLEVPTKNLGNLFTKHGSDKDTRHSYSWVYEKIIGGRIAPKILEIGVGSVNGFAYGGLPPGGSLKAWREAYPKAILVGADIDAEAISELNETGFVVNQLNQSSVENLKANLEYIETFDLIVDDGYHEPQANLRTYLILRDRLADDGVYIIEDIHESLIEFWRVIGKLLPDSLEIMDLRNQRPNCEDNILLVFRKQEPKFTTGANF